MIKAAIAVDKEGNYQASLWFRYLLLLSYRGETARVMVEHNPVGLPKQWKDSWGIGELLLEPLENKPKPTSAPSYLRWNQWPSDGHSSALIGSMTVTLQRLFKLEANPLTWQSEDTRKDADSSLSRIGSILTENLAIYDVLADPKTSIATPYSRQAWEASTTSRERDDLTKEYRTFKEYVLSRTQFYHHLRDAYGEHDPQARVQALATAFNSLPFKTGGREIAFFAAPKQAFDDYEKDFDTAAERSGGEKTEEVATVQLSQQLAEQRKLVDLERRRLSSADFGLAIAQSLSNLDENYTRIARLTAQASDQKVVEKIHQLNGSQDAVERAQLELDLKTRERDLVAAQVAALKTLLDEDGPRAIEDAKLGLKTLQQNMLKEADEYEKQAHNFLGNALKGFISIIGVITAACGAGPIAMEIAAHANDAIDAAVVVSGTNWTNPAQVIHNIGTAASTVEKLGVTLRIQVPTEVNQFQHQLNAYFQKGAATLDFIKQITDSRIQNQVASTLLSGFAIDSKSLNISLAQHVLSFEDPDLRQKLEAVLQNGGVFVNNAATRLAHFEKLTGKDDAALRAELGDAIEKAFPNLKIEIGIQRASYEAQLVQLKQYVSGKDISAETRRLVANILAQGMIVIQTDDGIRAVAADLEKEVEKRQADLKRIAQLVQWENLTKLGQNLTRQQARLEEEHQKISGMTDDKQKADALKKLANDDSIRQVEYDMTTTLNDIELQFRTAKEKLDDLEISVNIAKFTKKESESMLKAAKAGKEAEVLLKQANILAAQTADAVQDLNKRKVQQNTLDLDVATKRWELEEFRLANLNELCKIRNCDQTGSASQKSVSPVVQMFWGSKKPVGLTNDSIVLAEMVKNLIGMIQWVTLLNPVPGESQFDRKKCNISSKSISGSDGWNRMLLTILASPEKTTECLSELSAFIKDVYTVRAPEAPVYRTERTPFRRSTFHSAPLLGEDLWKITWRGPDADQDKIWNTIRVRLSGVNNPPEYELDRAVGYSTITLLKPSKEKKKAENTVPIGTIDSKDYILYSKIAVIPENESQSNLYFLIIPPEWPLAMPDDHTTLAECIGKDSEFKRDQASTDADANVDDDLNAAAKGLGQILGSMCLTGAGHGREWIVVLFHKNGDVTAAQQSKPILRMHSLSLRSN